MNFTALSRISSGFIEARILQVALKLGVFEAIKSEGVWAGEVAKVIGANPKAAELFLNALVAMKLLEKKGDRFFETEVSNTFLVKASPKYFGGMIIFEESLWGVWEKLEESVRTGKTARPSDMFQSKEEDTEKFILAMDSLVRARGDAEVLSRMLHFSWAKSMIDIGSGPGTYPIYFYKKNPHLKITIFDLPGTLKVTRKVLAKYGMEGKFELLAGDFNTDELPKGFDIAFLSNIIHSEGEKNNLRLTEKVYSSLNPKGEIIIKDHILDDSLTSPAVGAIFSVQMLLMTGGRDYSFTEVKEWLEGVGFEKVEWIRLEPPLTSSLVIAKKG